MELELGKKTIDAIAQRAAHILFSMMKKEQQQAQPDLVTTKEAAAILRISPNRMRQIADRYPHIKQGDSQSSRLLFDRKALIP